MLLFDQETQGISKNSIQAQAAVEAPCKAGQCHYRGLNVKTQYKPKRLLRPFFSSSVFVSSTTVKTQYKPKRLLRRITMASLSLPTLFLVKTQCKPKRLL